MPAYTIKNFPFEAGFSREPIPALPMRLDFTLDIDPQSGIIVEKLDDKIRSALRQYYETGGYGSTPLGEGDFATRQANQIIDALKSCLNSAGKRIETSDFLEIGSSYGYLLYLLKQEGAKSVMGVEPGDEGNIGSKKYGVPLVQDFFPTDRLEGKFDVIFSHAVVEHIEDPVFIVKKMVERLNPDGAVFLAVPECENKMRVGDVSIISHQHVNYFTSRSLQGLLEAAGLSEVRVIASSQRSILYAWGIKRETAEAPRAVVGSDEPLLSIFAETFEKNKHSMQTIIDGAESHGRSIGLYGASIVLKGILQFKTEPRLFDSDAAKHGKRMAGEGSAIESPEALAANPPDVIFVCPIDYDKEIRSFLSGLNLPQETEIISLKEIFEKNAGTSYTVGSVEAEKL
ncbi:MAG: class I SAM-dependent methyltransferase [Patescibacteria group bacterium]